jgi:nucleoside-diphosphate-sugar epimerase
MKCLVTGAAGFIGSHLCERLLQAGHTVVGIDAFVPYYPRPLKDANLQNAAVHRRFEFHTADLRSASLEPLLDGVETVFHLAAMPGLPRSWTEFSLYESCNVNGTQRLLESVRTCPTLHRFIYASTSSVYGRFASGDETLPTRPVSPYGVTKLAAENLCRAYAEECGLPLVVLRYFSVYGPRQRPDMGYHKFVAALLAGAPISVFGDGRQVRGNTYVSDCVEATVAAIQATTGETYNVGGGEAVSLGDVIRQLEVLTDRKADLHRLPARPGDQRHTFADTSRITRHLGWKPRVSLEEGLKRQVEWQRQAPLAAAA